MALLLDKVVANGFGGRRFAHHMASKTTKRVIAALEAQQWS